MAFIERSLGKVIRKAAGRFSCGRPHRTAAVGKDDAPATSVPETHRYVSLEPPDVRAAATEDPRSFRAQLLR